MGASSRGCCGIVVAAAVSFSIIQALIWLLLAVIAVLLRGCSLDLDTSGSYYGLVLIYFYNPECAPGWITSAMGGDFKPSKTTRTDAVTYYFLVTSALRLVTGIALLSAMVVATRRGRGVSRTGVFFWAWVVLVGCCLVGDLVCGIIYATDFADVESIWSLLGIDEVASIGALENYWALSIAPVMMMMLSFRWGLFWLAEVALFPAALRVFWKDRKEEKWLLRLSTSTVTGNTPPSVPVRWVTGSSQGARSDVVRRPGGGSDQRGPDQRGPDSPRARNDYQEPASPTGTDQTPYYLSVPADSMGWGGARPKESSWRGGGGGGDNGGVGNQWDHPGNNNGYRGGPPDRWNSDGSGQSGASRPSRPSGLPHRAAPPPPMRMQYEQSSAERQGGWDPRSPLPPAGAQPTPFIAPPQPTHSSFRPPLPQGPPRPSGVPVPPPVVPGPAPGMEQYGRVLRREPERPRGRAPAHRGGAAAY